MPIGNPILTDEDKQKLADLPKLHFGAYTLDTIAVSTNKDAPSYLTGVSLFPSSSKDFEIITDASGAQWIKNNSNKTFSMQGSATYQVSQGTGGSANLVLWSERTSNDGVTFTENDFSLRNSEVANNSSDSQTKSSGVDQWVSGESIRWAMYNKGPGSLSLDSPSDTVNGGNVVEGLSFYWQLNELAKSEVITPPVNVLSPLMLKYMPTSESYIANGSTSSGSSAFKLELEGGFSAIRLVVLNRGDAEGFNFAVAPTETMDNSNDNNRYKPIKNGVVDNSLWATGSLTSPLGGGDTRPQLIKSDFISVDSLIRADGGDKSGLILRVTGASSGEFQKVNANSDWELANGVKSFYRPLHVRSSTGADWSSDPANNNPSDPYTESWAHWVGIEYIPKVKGRTLYAMGDSITSGGGGQAYGYDNWSNIACFELSTEASPFTCINGGMSGKGSVDYVQAFYDMLDIGVKPTDIVIPAFTPNDGSPTLESSDARIARYVDVIARCKLEGIRVFLWTGLPVNNYSVDTFITYSNSWAEQLASTDPDITLVDFNSIASDGAVPMRFKAGYNNDNVHPSALCIREMADLLKIHLIS